MYFCSGVNMSLCFARELKDVTSWGREYGTRDTFVI